MNVADALHSAPNIPYGVLSNREWLKRLENLLSTPAFYIQVMSLPCRNAYNLWQSVNAEKDTYRTIIVALRFKL